MSVAGDTWGTHGRSRSWILPCLVGLATWITTALALSINLATDLIPHPWQDHPLYPWVVWGGTLLSAFVASVIASAVQRRNAARTTKDGEDEAPIVHQHSRGQSGGLSVGSNSGMMVIGDPDRHQPATDLPLLRIHRQKGSKFESLEIFSEPVAIAYLQLQVDSFAETSGDDDD